METLLMEIGRHLQEDDLERYSMGTMPEEEIAPIEEHLLSCEPCRQQLASCEEFIAAVRSAALQINRAGPARIPAAPTRGIRVFHPAWAFPVGLVALAFVLTRTGNFLQDKGPQPVALVAMRGAMPGAQAKAGERLALSPDVTGLPSFPSYRVEVVDALGRPVTTAEWKDSPVITPRLAAGTYFVRISSPAGDLLREYGLAVKRTVAN